MAGPRFMLKEIREAPQAAARLLEREGGRIRTLGARLRRYRPAGILMAARGSSDNAALYGKYILETRLGVPVTLAAPPTFPLWAGAPGCARTRPGASRRPGHPPTSAPSRERPRRPGRRRWGAPTPPGPP